MYVCVYVYMHMYMHIHMHVIPVNVCMYVCMHAYKHIQTVRMSFYSNCMHAHMHMYRFLRNALCLFKWFTHTHTYIHTYIPVQTWSWLVCTLFQNDFFVCSNGILWWIFESLFAHLPPYLAGQGCMYVCLYVCMYVCMSVERVCMYVPMYLCMYMDITAWIHACMHMFACVHVYIYALPPVIEIPSDGQQCVPHRRPYVCVYIYMYVCMYVYIYIYIMSICMHVCTTFYYQKTIWWPAARGA
jgi:hypothetical protein